MPKMIVIGDSHSARPKSFVWHTRIANLLHPDMETINLSAGGFSSFHALTALREASPVAADFGFVYIGINDMFRTFRLDPSTKPKNDRVTLKRANKLSIGEHLLIGEKRRKIKAIEDKTIILGKPVDFKIRNKNMISIDRKLNLERIIQQLKANGVTRIFIIGAHYRNISADPEVRGDFTSAQGYIQRPMMKTLRDDHRMVAQQCDVEFLDIAQMFSDRIKQGLATQGNQDDMYQNDSGGHLTDRGQERLIADPITGALSDLDILASVNAMPTKIRLRG